MDEKVQLTTPEEYKDYQSQTNGIGLLIKGKLRMANRVAW